LAEIPIESLIPVIRQKEKPYSPDTLSIPFARYLVRVFKTTLILTKTLGRK
jgi:hypothetical protein